jgi:hypothetical protein
VTAYSGASEETPRENAHPKPLSKSNYNQVLVSDCRDCNARWFGAIACHCAHCHQTFGKVSAFDAHLIQTLTDSFEAADPVCIPACDLPAEGFTLVRMDIWTRND